MLLAIPHSSKRTTSPVGRFVCGSYL